MSEAPPSPSREAAPSVYVDPLWQERAKHLFRSGPQAELIKGNPCYVPHDEQVFQPATIVNPNSAQVRVRTEDGEEITVPRAKVYCASDLGPEGVEDMTLLKHLHEPTIIDNLNLRFKARKIYSFVGSILVSVNPYTNVPIYTPSIARMYDGKPVGQLPPHIYAIADAAYAARGDGKNQSIYISGESGAGKTEAVKLILSYLTRISGKDRKQLKTSVTPQQRIMSTNPILEAFGNAKTLRNNNSSRFAKMIDVLFDETGYIVGGRVSNYLLEKSRVVSQAPSERNFHSFYYLLAGCDKTERAVWGLYDAKHYRFTNQTRVYEIKSVDSKQQYMALKRAMTVGGISLHQQHLIFTLLASILHMGNVRFFGEDEARIRNMEVVKWVAHLLKMDVNALSNALLFREATIGDETVQVPLSVAKAKDTRDSFASVLYSRNFDWLVNRLNRDMETDQYHTKISLLDIFGFEEYETNAFEQFCINYANERLQLEFNDHIFRQEMAEYIAEDIDVSKFNFEDNQPALDIIQRADNGLLTLLDGESFSPTGTDSSFLVRMRRAGDFLPTQQRWHTESVFAIKHYAGEVVYSVSGFLETNRQHFSSELLKAVRTSRLEHLKGLFEGMEESVHRKDKAHLSLSSQFREQLDGMMEHLSSAAPQYIRCIKPNSVQSSEIFDRFDVLRQLRCSGVMDTIRIRKDGYPFRQTQEDFLDRYGVLLPADLELREEEPQARAAELLAALGVTDERYQIGLTKVFLKDDLHHHLEGRRAHYYNSAAVIIQAHLKGFVQRRQYMRLRASCETLQYWFREYLVAVDVSEEVDAHLGALRSGSDMKGSVAALGALASRQANVRTIVGAGGIETIVGALGDGDDADMVSAGAKTLSAMAKADALHSTSIARSGAVTTMVSNIHASDAAQAHSIGLLGDLAEVDRNIGLVVREGGVDALTESMRKNARGEQSDYQLSRAALALGNLSKNKRVVRMIGSDHQAILAVIDGINAKPKYARLTQYSINCLANFAESRDNVDSIVDLGGIETMVAALKNHSRNEEVLREIARTFNEVARNPMYAKRIGELGTIELALRVLEDDPAYCGEHALAIIQAVCAHPANTSRLLRANGVSKFLALLASGIDNENVLTIAMRMLAALCQDPSIAIQVVDEDGSHTIHHSLNEHKEYAAHNRHAISALVELAEHHPDTKESLKGMDVVTSIALAMERHAEDEQLVQVGKAALGFLADQQDLENAVDVAARSRMKDQTERNLLVAGRAIVVISALALIEENIEYIASESGIPILLSIINGTSASVSDRIADQVLVPSIRAVARLLVDENNVDELISEGGVQSLVQALTGQSDKERACQVCTLAIDALIESNAGFLELVKHQGLEALVTVLAERSDFEAVVLYILALMAKIARTKSNGIRWLVERGALEAIIRVLQEYAQSSQTILKSCTLLLLLLSSSKRVDKQRLYVCADLALGGVRVDPSDAEVIISTLKFVFKLSRDPDGAAYMQEKGSAATILMLLDEHYGHAELTALGTQLLGNITRNQELLDALESLYALAQDLVRNPEDETIMQSMVSPVTLIGSMASNPKAASVIVQNQGLDTLSRALMAAEEAKKCIEQEKLLKHLAFTLSRIASHRRHTEAIVLSGCVQHTLEAVGRHIDYEEFVEEVQIGLENLSRSPEAISYLIDAGTPKTVQAMVAAHPLNDKILVSATRFLVRLAKGCELKVMRRIRKEGFQLALVGVGRFMSAEDHIIDALHNVGRLATLSHDGTHVVVGAKAIALFQQVMKKHVNSPAVVTAATQAFSALADNPDFATALMTESIADQVIAGLDMYGDNEDYCARAIAVLYKMALVPENIAYLEEKGAAGLCMETMARHAGSEMVQLQSLLLMSALARDKEMSRALANTGAIRMVFNAVRAHPLSPPVVQAGVSFARAIAAVPDNIPALVAERASEMTQWAVRAYPQNAQLQTVCKETLELLETALPEQTGKGDEEEDEEEIDVAIPGLAAMEGRDSRRVVKKLVSIVKVIKNPIDDNALREALVKLSDSKASQDTLDEMMKYGGLARLVAILDANTANAPLVCAVVKCLLRFADKGEHINLIVAHGAIGALLRAMVAHAENPDLTALGVRFIGKLSVYNRLKVLIGLQGGVQVLLAAMERFIAIAPLINRTTYCLGNMASNCLPNRRAIIKGGGVGFICFAMQKHRSFLDLVINAARALSPLCADDDASRQSVAKSGASLVIIRAVLHQPQNPGLLQNGLNCLHKISKRKDTLPTLIHQQAVQAVVAGMNAYAANTELQQFGMEILSNLSSHRSRETNPVLTQGGTITAVIKSAIRHHKHTRIQIASYECLQNLASSNRDAEEIVKTGFVNKLLDSLSAPRAQEKLLEEGVSLLTVLASKSEMNAKDLIECGAVEVLVELLRKYNEYRETMRLSLVCLSKLSMTEEHAGILARKGVVNATVEAMLDREDDDRFLVDALKTLVNMALLESNAIAISETAIEPIIASIDHHFSSQAFLRAVYMLLSNLSMWPRASKHLIEQGMIAVIVATMRASTSYPAVVSKMVRVLTNFTLVQGSIRLLKRDGAVFAVREVSAMHANHIQLKKAADAFLLKVVGKRKETSFARAADLITYVKQHVTEHNRNLLTSGWLFTRRSKDGAKPHVVAVTLDFEHLTWSDPKNKSSQIKSMPIRNVSDVVAGACTEQLRTKAGLFGNVAVPEHSFAIFSSRDNTWSLSLEAEDQSSAAAFVLALQQLIQAHTAYTVGLQ